jgi:hypothetical protein
MDFRTHRVNAAGNVQFQNYKIATEGMPMDFGDDEARSLLLSAYLIPLQALLTSVS